MVCLLDPARRVEWHSVELRHKVAINPSLRLFGGALGRARLFRLQVLRRPAPGRQRSQALLTVANVERRSRNFQNARWLVHLWHLVHLSRFDLKLHLDHHVQVFIGQDRNRILGGVLNLCVCNVLDVVQWQFLICDHISVCIVLLPSIEFKHGLAEACLGLGLGLDLVDPDVTGVIAPVFHGFVRGIADIFCAVYIGHSYRHIHHRLSGLACQALSRLIGLEVPWRFIQSIRVSLQVTFAWQLHRAIDVMLIRLRVVVDWLVRI